MSSYSTIVSSENIDTFITTAKTYYEALQTMNSVYEANKALIEGAWKSSDASDAALTGFEETAKDIKTHDEDITNIESSMETVRENVISTEKESAGKVAN